MNDQKILCPHCNKEMDTTSTDIICHKCGYVVQIEWIVKTALIFFPKGLTIEEAMRHIINGESIFHH